MLNVIKHTKVSPTFISTNWIKTKKQDNMLSKHLITTNQTFLLSL